jgi:hypothetical protein
MTATDPTPAADITATNREAWLVRAIDLFFRPEFAKLGYKIPDPIHVSVGWGCGRAGAESKDIAGQCWSGVASKDSAPHIFISPMVDDPIEVLAILAHELVHATLDPIMDHGKPFRTLALEIGLVGPMAATEASNGAAAEYMLLAEPTGLLGVYPHSAISIFEFARKGAPVPQTVGGPPRRITSGPAKQTGSRHIRVFCPDHPQAFAVRSCQSAVDQGSTPLCGVNGDDGTPCGLRMVPPAG